jgi:hypothetical protein
VTPVKVVGDKLQYHLGYAPRLMDVERAAAYVGFGPTKFRELVVERKMPEPVDVDGLPRWDRYQLDARCLVGRNSQCQFLRAPQVA